MNIVTILYWGWVPVGLIVVVLFSLAVIRERKKNRKQREKEKTEEVKEFSKKWAGFQELQARLAEKNIPFVFWETEIYHQRQIQGETRGSNLKTKLILRPSIHGQQLEVSLVLNQLASGIDPTELKVLGVFHESFMMNALRSCPDLALPKPNLNPLPPERTVFPTDLGSNVGDEFHDILMRYEELWDGTRAIRAGFVKSYCDFEAAKKLAWESVKAVQEVKDAKMTVA